MGLIAAGYLHTCAVTTGGAAYCWGSNTWGQLGNRTIQDRSRPGRVAGGIVFRSVATGSEHTCGLDVGGTPYWLRPVGNGPYRYVRHVAHHGTAQVLTRVSWYTNFVS